MESLIFMVLLVVSMVAGSQQFQREDFSANRRINAKSIRTLQYSNDHSPDGSYKFDFLTENGISRDETGSLKNLHGHNVISMVGSYSYISPEGHVITVNYIADENGFRTFRNSISRLGHVIPKASTSVGTTSTKSGPTNGKSHFVRRPSPFYTPPKYD